MIKCENRELIQADVRAACLFQNILCSIPQLPLAITIRLESYIRARQVLGCMEIVLYDPEYACFGVN